MNQRTGAAGPASPQKGYSIPFRRRPLPFSRWGDGDVAVARRTRKKTDRLKEGAPPSVHWKNDRWSQEEVDAYNKSSLIDSNHPMFATVKNDDLRAEGLLKPEELSPELRPVYADMDPAQRQFFASRIKRGRPPSGWEEIVAAFQEELKARGVQFRVSAAARFLTNYEIAIVNAEGKQAERSWWHPLEESPVENLLSTIAVAVVRMAKRSVTTHKNTNERHDLIARTIRSELAKRGLNNIEALGWGKIRPFETQVAKIATAAVLLGDCSAKEIKRRTVQRVRKEYGL
jgi:hypothetical protein